MELRDLTQKVLLLAESGRGHCSTTLLWGPTACQNGKGSMRNPWRKRQVFYSKHYLELPIYGNNKKIDFSFFLPIMVLSSKPQAPCTPGKCSSMALYLQRKSRWIFKSSCQIPHRQGHLLLLQGTGSTSSPFSPPPPPSRSSHPLH